MRITKVKVNSETVLMQRDSKEGFLTCGVGVEKQKKQGAVLTLLQQKDEEFNVSLLNKTLARPNDLYKDLPENLSKEKLKEYRRLLKDSLAELSKLFRCLLGNHSNSEFSKINTLKQLTEVDLKKLLNHRFSSEKPTYYLSNGTKKSFCLLAELKQALENHNTLVDVAGALEDYRLWAIWYKKNKQEHLANSIIHNNINPSATDTPRKKVLDGWAKQLMEKGKIDLTDLEKNFELTALVKRWNTIWEEEKKIDQKMVDEAKKNNKRSPENKDIGLPANGFEFKRRLKIALQACYQKDGELITRLKADPELNQYSLEVSKYLMHYFPLKKSRRTLSIESIDYILKEDTVRKTINHQIVNATMQYLLQQGKVLHYGLTDGEENTLNSDKLQDIKGREVFALQLINACAFAANNLRNCVDPYQENDILGKSDLKKSLLKYYNNEEAPTSKDAVNKQTKERSIFKLSQFFIQLIQTENTASTYSIQEIVSHLKESDDHYLNFVAAIRSAIQSIRNKIIHFKRDAIDIIFKGETFEAFKYGQGNTIKDDEIIDKRYASTYLQTLFDAEINSLPFLFSEKLKTMGLFDFYEVADIQAHLASFNLHSKPLAFIPGFKKIFSWGDKYQRDEESGLGLRCYFNKALREIEDNKAVPNLKDEARYNALSLLYKQQFVPFFVGDNALFFATVDAVISANKNRAKIKSERPNNKTKEEQYAFAKVEEIVADLNTNALPPREFLQTVQGELFLEENRKREDGSLSADGTGHFQQFLWQLFLKGFDTFISQEQFAFIATPMLQIPGKLSKQEEADWRNQKVIDFLDEHIQATHQIQNQENNQVAFWSFCKMLDARHLNELQNQLSKLAQAQTKNVIKPKNSSSLPILQEIIELCLLSADITPNNWLDIYQLADTDQERGKKSWQKSLMPYLSEDIQLHLQKEPFHQEDGTPIVFAQVELAKRYATENVLKRFFEAYPLHKLSSADLKKWEALTTKATIQENPANWAQERRRLHMDWENAKIKTSIQPKNKPPIQGWLDKPHNTHDNISNAVRYQELCANLDEYNWLDNKVHLVHIKNLHHMLIDILGRMAGFVAIRERDCCFLEERAKISTSSEYKKNILNPIKTEPCKEKRNYIAHFNYLTQSESKYSILELLSHTRSLVSYDRKLKNAVAKSFIDLLDRHGIVIKFEPLHKDNHEFKIDSIKPKKIKHLGGGKTKGSDGVSVETDHVHQEYVDMVENLLKYKT